MSIPKKPEEIIKHKDQSLSILDSYMSDLINTDPKKADLLAYWLHTYTRYLKFEEIFQPARNKKYNRGDIIRVNLGFNIGSEHGGLHYAMVLDINNEKNSPIVTIIPLSSSEGKSPHKTEVDLGDEIYKQLLNKTKGMLQTSITEANHIKSMLQLLSVINQNLDTNNTKTPPVDYIVHKANTTNAIETLERKNKIIEQRRDELNKILYEVKKMKRGSIAMISQITTISKIRIEDPKNTHGVLNGIRLSPENLDKINEKIKTLYLFEEK